MATITATELCSAGTFVEFTDASQNDLGDQTVIVYWKPTAIAASGSYIYAKTPSGSTLGPRGLVGASKDTYIAKTTTGAPGAPYRQSVANAVTLNAWQHLAFRSSVSATSDFQLTEVNGVQPASADWGSGFGGFPPDAAHPLYLMNRYGLSREVIGHVAYIARWSAFLNDTQMTNVRNNGPLAEPTNLVLCWANNQDYGPNTLTPSARSTFAAGELPPNLALGGAASPDGSATGALPSITLTAPAATASGTGGANGNATGVLQSIVLTAPAGTAVGTGVGTITTPVLKNNTGNVLSSETGVIVNIYNATTGVLIVQKTAQTSNGSGVVTVTDALLVPATTYAYEVILTGSRRRLPTASAT